MHMELKRNLPTNNNWESSFYERLSEYGEWNYKAFWILHLELINIAKNINDSEIIERELATILITLQQKILNLIVAHFNKKDIFKISNLKEEELFDFIERFEMAILGALSGVVIPESSFDLVNPLIYPNSSEI